MHACAVSMCFGYLRPSNSQHQTAQAPPCNIAREMFFVAKMLCAQHRNGNVVERVTKLLGILPGCYCVAKVCSKGKQFKDLKEAVRKQLQRDLVVMEAEPPGLQAEWSAARE